MIRPPHWISAALAALRFQHADLAPLRLLSNADWRRLIGVRGSLSLTISRPVAVPSLLRRKSRFWIARPPVRAGAAAAALVVRAPNGSPNTGADMKLAKSLHDDLAGFADHWLAR